MKCINNLMWHIFLYPLGAIEHKLSNGITYCGLNLKAKCQFNLYDRICSYVDKKFKYRGVH